MQVRNRNAAIPSGDLYPNGVPRTLPNPAVQATTHVPGSYFQKSPGFETIRPGRHRLQKGFHGHGINFTPQRFAEDVGVDDLPLMVDEDTASKHADIAELPGSERLDDEGKTTAQEDRVYLAQHGEIDVATGTVEQRHRHTMDLDGIRDESVRWSSGLLRNPVDFISDEYAKTPVKAVIIASGIVAFVYVVSRDFERSYRRRKRRAGIAAAPAAAVETTGTTVAKVVEVPAKVVETVSDAVKDVVTDTTDAVADTTD